MLEASPTSRWAAIWLPNLATDRLIRSRAAPADAPFATTRKDKNRIALAAVNAPARAAGLAPGLALADARARIPTLEVAAADEDADFALLDRIGAWCERFTPSVVIDAPDGLFLDITGCTHLFGGETKLRGEIERRLREQGFHARAAIAPTPGAAWALARYGQRETAECTEIQTDIAETLAPLPIAALRLDEAAEDFLLRLGLRKIGQIAAAPRASFAARAGERALLRLDQALGRAREALSPRRPPAPVFADRRFIEPLVSETAIEIGLDSAARDVAATLEQRGAGAARFTLLLFPVSGPPRRVSIALSRPARDAKLLLRLFREKFAALAGPLCDEFGIEAIRLCALELSSMTEITENWAEAGAPGNDVHALIDAVNARLGASAALRPKIRAENLPELAGACAPVLAAAAGGARPSTPSIKTQGKPRPLHLFASPQPVEAVAGVPDGPPERFRWRRVLRRIVRAEGPERIAPPWFSPAHGPTRDYFRVEDEQGRRFWLYREGMYNETPAPKWFVHGLFA
jgi:protein ImuB